MRFFEKSDAEEIKRLEDCATHKNKWKWEWMDHEFEIELQDIGTRKYTLQDFYKKSKY